MVVEKLHSVNTTIYIFAVEMCSQTFGLYVYLGGFSYPYIFVMHGQLHQHIQPNLV